MKIVIAPDSFKDSLSAQGVADAIAQGLAEVWPDAQLIKCPMADGGEGTVESVLAACNGEWRHTRVRGPLGVAVEARWGWLAESRTAIDRNGRGQWFATGAAGATRCLFQQHLRHRRADSRSPR